jgi:dTDP-4-amino-4,6-dideoxygalactose transaminase
MNNHNATTSQLFWETLDVGTYIRCFFRGDSNKFLNVMRHELGSDNVYLTSSGRGAIILSLRAAGIGRNDEVFVPPFLSACVLDSIVRGGTPTLHFTKETKAVLLYHHWGYAQNFEAIKKRLAQREIVVVEDCAHGFWGETNKTKIGSFGDTAIMSLSKIFKTTYVGAVKINNGRYSQSILNDLGQRTSPREHFEHLLGEMIYLSYYRNLKRSKSRKSDEINMNRWYSTLLLFPKFKGIRGYVPTTSQDALKVFERQNQNFLFLLDRLGRSFLLKGDNLSSMAPLCYPFMSEDQNTLAQAVEWLERRGIRTGIYHFDVRRNMFDPLYTKCVPLPLHCSIDREVLHSFAGAFKG